MTDTRQFREIPYNYTSFSDREIILSYFNEEILSQIDRLRLQRITGRSARLIAETLGDLFIIDRNPYVREDFLENPRRLRQLELLHRQRLETVQRTANDNADALDLLQQLRRVDHDFFSRLQSERRLRQHTLVRLTGTTARANISFTPFDRVSHSTDATDWRVEQPMAVVYPDTAEEIPQLVSAIRELGCAIIPRGGGTGLTGGAIPVKKNTVVINTEKLNRIAGISEEHALGIAIPVVTVEAGAITEDVIEYCSHRGFIFATDPTSAWASTIGGNVAENAGGKKCVQWGTAIDNLFSWKMVTARGEIIEVRRRDHPYRKIHPDDTIIFDVVRCSPRDEAPLHSISLRGTEIRKRGLGKDITNKVLGGLPGVQKEGGDGIIISARFVLYRPFAHCRTLCLEFFGRNLINASKAILDIRTHFDGTGPAVLTALEHFDERYVRAIHYRNRSPRTDIPKAVLLIDVEGNDADAVAHAVRTIGRLVQPYETEAIAARDEQERTLFWKDRKNLGAIAQHTNAFKLNEDIVIPLESLPVFADFIERMNFSKEFANGAAVALAVNASLNERSNDPDSTLLARVRQLQEHSSTWAIQLQEWSAFLGDPSATEAHSLLARIQEGSLAFSEEADLLAPLRASLHGYDELLTAIEAAAEQERRRRIIIATHMHAGDGNIHVNIPVHSSDYLMMQEADATAAAIMREAVRLGGVVSGEHGIGLTKLKFLDPEVLDAFQAYKRSEDPGQLFNPGKLDKRFPLHRIYTPSFSLLELEAFILEATDLEQLSMKIAMCVRCGKCKPVCCTQIPRLGMMYNPRNKILAVGQITEAVLYYAQTSGLKSFHHFAKLKDISDHCTVCHKCRVPCPVKIDFGSITTRMRRLQDRRLRRNSALSTRLALFYLWRTGYASNKALRIGVLRPGYALQRFAHRLYRSVMPPFMRTASRLGAMLDGIMTARGRAPLRERLGLRGQRRFYSFMNPDVPVRSTVIYFPGCGSERMFPEISIAAIALLYRAGVRVIIPPAYSCCGYPFQANGKQEQANLRSFENRVVFHRMADSVGASGIDAIVVSCGTCYDMLEQYELRDVFPKAPLLDVNEFLVMNELIPVAPKAGTVSLYHEPCHSPLRSLGYQKTITALTGASPTLVPECCGEAGTLTLSRPDVSCVLRMQKQSALKTVATNGSQEILTTCPSCVAGLSKQTNGTRVSGKALVVHVAEQALGKDWEREFLKEMRERGVEEVLF